MINLQNNKAFFLGLIIVSCLMILTSLSSFYLACKLAGISAFTIPIIYNNNSNENHQKSLFPTNIGYLGPTKTAGAPFLAQTNDAALRTGNPTIPYTPPQPIETSIQAMDSNNDSQNIFELFGTISPYYISEGWGIYEYGLPKQCKIEQVHILSRHGTRYNTKDSLIVNKFDNKDDFEALNELSFLNDWEYDQGINILTSLGNQQLFDKGIRNFFRYGKLFNWNNDDKLVVRSTSQERMTMSATYFLIGFFGVNWQDYVNLELLIEEEGFNSSLASYDNCPSNVKWRSKNLSQKLTKSFLVDYLEDAKERFNKNLRGIELSIEEIYSIQELCTFESVTLGYSKFCSLFTIKEWEDYEYYNSWNWYNENFFGCPTSRALGISWVEEFKRRILKNEINNDKLGIQNRTLNENPIFFPLDQDLFIDFTHDSIITNIYSALGFEQFKSNFTNEGKKQPFDISKVVPFASQSIFEIINCDSKIPNDRSKESLDDKEDTKYIHLMLNDHTLPLHENIPKFCEYRIDGYCELNKFLEYLETLYDESKFEKSCFGEFADELVENGVPN